MFVYWSKLIHHSPFTIYYSPSLSTVIKVENLSKLYRFGNVGAGSMVHDINRTGCGIYEKEGSCLKAVYENYSIVSQG
jgi:hypothetical protein